MFCSVICHAAISYAFEAEADRRKQGLLSRVVFLNKSGSDQDHQSTGTLDLREQNKRACVKTKVKLQVCHTLANIFPHQKSVGKFSFETFFLPFLLFVGEHQR